MDTQKIYPDPSTTAATTEATHTINDIASAGTNPALRETLLVARRMNRAHRRALEKRLKRAKRR